MAVAIRSKCWGCEDMFNQDDLFDCDDGVLRCDECDAEYRADNFFDCATCGEERNNADMSDRFVLFDSRFGSPGMYEILFSPFFSQPMVGNPSLYSHAVQRLGDIPDGAVSDGHPATHICTRCME